MVLWSAAVLVAGEVDRPRVQQDLERLSKSNDARICRPAISLLTQLDYYDYTHGGGGYAWGDEDSLAALASDTAALAAGRDPFAAKRGTFTKGYFAQNDQSRQPYSISIPEKYDPNTPIPLVLSLHCHGWTTWYRPFQGNPAPSLDDAIVVSPHGRGSCDYMWIAEDDCLAVLDEVMRDYRIDPDRVYVTGWSMGGTGSWNLAARFPDRFAGSFPVAGNADISAWITAWKKKEEVETPLRDFRWFMRINTSPVTFAENLVHVPVTCSHGALDSIVPVEHARSMTNRLRQLGYPNVRYAESEGAGHFWVYSTTERYDWLKQFRRDPLPKRVRYKTAWYRYPGAYWAEIVRFGERLKFAEIDAQVVNRNRIEVKADNITRFKLKLNDKLVDMAQPLTVAVGDKTASVAKLSQGGELILDRDTNGEWRAISEAPAAGLRKIKGLEGPIEDCVRSRFLVVYGTQGDDAWHKLIIRREAMRWCNQWKRRFVAMPPSKADHDVTDDEITKCNLILFGGPATNSLSARIAPKLPVRPEGNRIIVGERSFAGEDVGMKVCYPNPLQPDRMVVMLAANSWKGMWQLTHRFGNWFDWVPYDNRDWFDYAVFDDRTSIPETFLEFGFLDDDWKLDRRYSFRGVEEFRANAEPRVYPRWREAPDAESVCLSDVMPTEINTAKGPLVLDRSWGFKPLSIGERQFEKGLGLKVMSSVDYALDGRFRTFEVWVGVDLEGEKEVSPERAAAESVTFTVYGDGKPLASESRMGWNTPARRISVNVEGVRVLRLEADKETPEGWHYGCIAWGEPKVGR